jgi:hypothetical protein
VCEYFFYDIRIFPQKCPCPKKLKEYLAFRSLIRTFAVKNRKKRMKRNRIMLASAAMTAVLSLASCDNNRKFTVTGEVTNAQDSLLYLENVGIEDIDVIDSVKLGADGQFTLKGNATEAPEFYRLRIDDQIINLSIDSTETVTVKAQYPQMATQYEVSGSDNCQKIKELALMQIQLQQQRVDRQNGCSLPCSRRGEIQVDGYQSQCPQENVSIDTEEPCSGHQ